MITKKQILSLMVGITLFTSAKSVEINRENLLTPAGLEDVRLFHKDGNFEVLKDGEVIPVQRAFIDREVRNLNEIELGYFLGTIKDVNVDGTSRTFYKVAKKDVRRVASKANIIVQANRSEADMDVARQLSGSSYLVVNQFENGEYYIHSHSRMLGGGPLLAVAGYWLTKVICYGTATAATVTAVIAVAPAAAGVIVSGATAAAATLAGGVVAGGVGAVAVTATGAVGAAIATTAGEAAVVATVTTISAAGGVAATVAAVETASMGVAAFLAWLPTP